MSKVDSAPVSKSLVLLLASTACFMVILDTTIVNVATNSIRTNFAATLSGLQWVVDGYTLTFAALLLSAGALSDRVGPRRAFGLGLAVFSAASLACGLATGLAPLTIARGVQGAGAALLIPSSLALISRTFTEKIERNRALFIWGGVGGGLAMVAGPLFGGLLTSAFGWRSVFLINVPVGVAGLLLMRRLGADSASKSTRSLDLPGQALAIAALSALTFLFIEGPSLGWGSVPALGAAAVALVTGIGFLIVESRTAEPMLPLNLFGIRDFSLASGVGFGLNFAFYGQMFFLNVYLQQGLHMPPAAAGMRFLPETAGGILLATTATRMASKIAPRNFVILGTALSALGMFGLSFFGLRGNSMIDTLFLFMIGTGIGTPASILAVMLGSIGPERAGIASGAFNAARQVGGLLGVAVLGALVGHASPAGVHTALILAGGFMLASHATALGMRRAEISSEHLADAAAEAMA